MTNKKGVKLKTQELERKSVSEFKEMEKRPIVVVLDNVRSLHNVGSAFRTADAFSIEKIVLCGITARPPHREIQKTALGATESVNWSYEKSTLDAIQSLKNSGYSIAGVEQVVGSAQLNKLESMRNDKVALVFGNEVNGVEQSVLDFCDTYVEIPQSGTKHSLNISVSIGIVLWELTR